MMKNENYNMRDIKMILQKNDLQVSSIRRVKYGPYTVGTLKPGQISEADVDSKIKSMFFWHKKKILKETQKEMAKKIEMIRGDEKKGFDLLTANKKMIQEKLLIN